MPAPISAATRGSAPVAEPMMAPATAPPPAPTSAPPAVFEIWVLPVYGLTDVQALSESAASPAIRTLDFILPPCFMRARSRRRLRHKSGPARVYPARPEQISCGPSR